MIIRIKNGELRSLELRRFKIGLGCGPDYIENLGLIYHSTPRTIQGYPIVSRDEYNMMVSVCKYHKELQDRFLPEDSETVIIDVKLKG